MLSTDPALERPYRDLIEDHARLCNAIRNLIDLFERTWDVEITGVYLHRIPELTERGDRGGLVKVDIPASLPR